MSAGWEWAQAARERALAPLPGGYRIATAADDRAYWTAWEATFGRLATLTPELLAHRYGVWAELERQLGAEG